MLGLESLFELRRVKPCAEMVKMTACRMETLVAQAVYAGVPVGRRRSGIFRRRPEVLGRALVVGDNPEPVGARTAGDT